VQGRDLGVPGFDLDEPGTIEFTAERALRGRELNRFALSLRSPGNRAGFLAGERAYLQRFRLAEEEIGLVLGRDWTGLMRAGGHLHALLKLAAAVGEDLWSIGAHNAGCTREELLAGTPRRVSGLPAGAWAAKDGAAKGSAADDAAACGVPAGGVAPDGG
jgi:protocatechuate 4,5-dioxygenase, alpha chain